MGHREYTKTSTEQVDEEFEMISGDSGCSAGWQVVEWDSYLLMERLRPSAPRNSLANKTRLESALPFAMDPVTYEFSINENGTSATLRNGPMRYCPSYYQATLPRLLKGQL